LPDTRKFGRQLERELEFFQSAFNEQGDVLSKVIEQRDRLAEVLNDLWHNYSLTGAAYELIEKALAAVKGGSDE
jgi:hypothetical protein